MYRYASLFITSLFYFIAPTNHSIDRKLFIIACIGVSSIILNYIYIKKNNDISVVKLLVFIETIGNSIMLIPSGGLNSPYVWYALNTIFISAVMLEKKHYWLNLLVYLVASTWMTYYIFNDKQQRFIDIIKQQSNLIISFILITIAVWLLLRYIKEIKLERKKLLKINGKLIAANQQVKESVNHIMELYHAVDMFSNTKNKNEIIELILEYSNRMLTTDMVVFYDNDKKENMIGTAARDVCKRTSDQLRLKMSEIWQDLEQRNSAVQINIEDKAFLVISVKSNYTAYGILGVEIKPKKDGFNQIESMDQLKFLADLSSIVLEKFELEKVNDKLIITEEQNRIANEIHDSVLQRLFSTSFGIYGLMKRLNKANIKEADADLNLIRESIDHAMKELRTAIYGLSWKKDGTDNFIVDLANYINEIKRMNNIDIILNIIGNSEYVEAMSKKAIYRIVCEGIGNAIRHGKANHIEITLNIKADAVQLRIIDDGSGFDLEAVNKSKQGGLGVGNIRFLVSSLRGKVDYQSTIGNGTRINIVIPNHMNEIRGDKVV
jgi:signal transduction histidine kinase